MNLVLEVNQEAEEIQQKEDKSSLMGGRVMITPPVGEDFWLMRVKVSKKQSIVAFPKFGTIGVGFAIEEDWNTNLPYLCDAEEIFNHIKHNRGGKIPMDRCLEAITMIQTECHRLRGTDPVKNKI